MDRKPCGMTAVLILPIMAIPPGVLILSAGWRSIQQRRRITLLVMALIIIFVVLGVSANSQQTPPNILPLAAERKLLPHPELCGLAMGSGTDVAIESAAIRFTKGDLAANGFSQSRRQFPLTGCPIRHSISASAIFRQQARTRAVSTSTSLRRRRLASANSLSIRQSGAPARRRQALPSALPKPTYRLRLALSGLKPRWRGSISIMASGDFRS